MVCQTGAQSSISTKVPPVLMLCQLGAPTSKSQESMLVQASARNKASLVLMVCETGAPRSTSMCLDCSRHLRAPRPHRCRCWASPRHTRHEPMLVEAFARNKARWCRWCPRQVPKQHKHQGPTCADVVPIRCPHQQKARVDAGPGIRAQQGLAGADGVRDRWPRKHKLLPRLF